MITLRHQLELETLFLVSIAAAVSLFYVISSNNRQSSSMPIKMPLATNSISALAITDPVSKASISSQISPDGTKKVIMKVTRNNDNTATYDFSTTGENDANQQYVFTKTLDLPKSMTIPFNTWSPDNKYFFVQENAGGNKSILVFKATGEPFSDAEKYLDVANLFNQKNTGNNFDEATGWASETLIIINTKKADNAKGFSYWFEVPSKIITQLSSEF